MGMKNKIFNLNELKGIIKRKQEEGLSIVFTNGCFDLLHVGHTRYLTEAKEKGDILIVGINSDSSIKRLKGEQRPIINEEERAELLSYLEMVDYIVVFDEPTAEKLISVLKPDIYVKGGDYRIEELPEARIVEENGGKVELVSMVEGVSTTEILSRIIGSC